MKPYTTKPNIKGAGATAHQRGSSSGTANVATITLKPDTSQITIAVETTSARVTFDGTDPSVASAPSIVFPKDSLPLLQPVGAGTVIKWCSTAAAASVVQVAEFI